MISISKAYSFDAGHQLISFDLSDRENRTVFGKCFNRHGHTYTLVVEVSGKVNPSTGMILNYFNLDKIVKPIVDGILDHTDLNEVFPRMLTTAENLVWKIRGLIVSELPKDITLESVTLSETPKTTAKWIYDRNL